MQYVLWDSTQDANPKRTFCLLPSVSRKCSPNATKAEPHKREHNPCQEDDSSSTSEDDPTRNTNILRRWAVTPSHREKNLGSLPLKGIEGSKYTTACSDTEDRFAKNVK